MSSRMKKYAAKWKSAKQAQTPQKKAFWVPRQVTRAAGLRIKGKKR